MNNKIACRAGIILGTFISESAFAFQDTALPGAALPGIVAGIVLVLITEIYIWVKRNREHKLQGIRDLLIIYIGAFVSYVLFLPVWGGIAFNGTWGFHGVTSFDDNPNTIEIIYQTTIGAVWMRPMPKGYIWILYMAAVSSVTPLFVGIVFISWWKEHRHRKLTDIFYTKLLYMLIIYIASIICLLITETDYFIGV